jgi:hypothetical protein
MRKVSVVNILCVVGFLTTITMAIFVFVWHPEGLMVYVTDAFGIPVNWQRQTPEIIFGPVSQLMGRMLAILLVTVSLAYLLALIYPEAAHPLLMVATSDKVLVVLYALGAFFAGTYKGRLGQQFTAFVILDAILVLAGIYAVVVTRKQKGAGA